LQANKWQTYAIVILATPTSGHLIRIVQNEAISTTSPKKNGKFTNDALLSALAITIAIAIAGHSSLARPDRLLHVLQPFPSAGSVMVSKSVEHDLGLLGHEHGLGLEELGRGLGLQELGPRLGLQEPCLGLGFQCLCLGLGLQQPSLSNGLGLQQPSLSNGLVSGNILLLEINEALGGGLLVSALPLLPLGSGFFLLGYELLEGFLERQGAGLPDDVGLGSLVA
jgi:hypothetical protein